MEKKLVTATFAMTLLLTGCSSSDDDKNVSKNTGKETFTAGMECNYAPFNWQTKEQTKTSVFIGGVGFCDDYDVCVARQIAKDLGREIVIKKVSRDGLQPALESSETDATIAGMTKDETHENGIDFASLYCESGMVMIVHKEGKAVKFNDIQQFKSKTIIRQESTNYDTIIDQIKDVRRATPKATYSEMVLSLQNEKVDGVTAEFPVAEGAVEANKDLTIVHFVKGKGSDIDTSVSVGLEGGSCDSESFNAVQKSPDGISKETRDQQMKEARESQPKTG